MIASAVRNYLIRQGYDVDSASELEEAQAMLANDRYDVVILDLRRARMTKLEYTPRNLAVAGGLKRISAPMIGGLFTSFLMELLVYPAIYLLWRERSLPHPEHVDDERQRHHWLQRPAFVTGLSGVVVALGIAGSMFFSRAEAKPLFPRYESVRQSLLKGSLDGVKSNAVALAIDARTSKQAEIAKDADGLAKSNDIEAARHAFATLSDAMIAYRAAGNEQPKPQVVYCPMAKHSWLQAKGDISNPYFADPAMRGCGEMKSN